jgi:hypothetical protein
MPLVASLTMGRIDGKNITKGCRSLYQVLRRLRIEITSIIIILRDNFTKVICPS